MLTRRKLPFPAELYDAAVRRTHESFFGRLMSRLTGQLSPSRALARDLVNGAEELVVEPNEVAVHAIDAGGPFVFLEAGVRTVLLAGDWLLDVELGTGEFLEPKRWWPRAVRVIRAPTGGQVLRMEVIDPTPLPVRVVSPMLSDFRESCILQNTLSELQGEVAVREAMG